MNKPDLETVIEYGQTINLPKIECEKFYDYYETIGWVVGRARTPMKQWKSAVRNWKRNYEQYSRSNQADSGYAGGQQGQRDRQRTAKRIRDFTEPDKPIPNPMFPREQSGRAENSIIVG